MKPFFRPLCVFGILCIHLSTRAQVPALNSYSPANAVIFLDFDGHTVAGTSWNFAGPIVCGASGLNNSQIIEIFNRVAEDYRPFNINITTDSTKFLAAPINKRMRVVVTVSSSWYGAAGGVAFTGSFVWGDDSPCFVFSALLNNNVKFVAEAISHEAGHTLGLYHQALYDASCNKLSDYYAGQGSGEIGWAPIMGVGYYQNFTLWNNGPNSYGCNNYQSDLDIINSATNGFGYRTDDHAATATGSSLSVFTNNQFTATGVIERNIDQDMFHFIIPTTGHFQLDAVPYNVGTGNAGSDLDMQITLLDESQNILNIYNPGALLSSVIDTTLNGGTYYIRVEGKGNQYAPAYASLGSYSLQGSFDGGLVLPLHQLQLQGTKNGDVAHLSWNIEATEQVAQQILEIAIDGRNFVPLVEPSPQARGYSYHPDDSGARAQYRLKVTFDDGHQYYSNIATIRETQPGTRPVLASNLIQTGSISINSPGDYVYTLIDMSGRSIRKGRLVSGTNTVDANTMTPGIYVIQFAGNGQQWTDKLLRQ
jgi:hypothetical protein